MNAGIMLLGIVPFLLGMKKAYTSLRADPSYENQCCIKFSAFSFGLTDSDYSTFLFLNKPQKRLTVRGGDIILVRILEKLNCYRLKNNQLLNASLEIKGNFGKFKSKIEASNSKTDWR
jgi:hypothetical protein